MPVHGFSSEQNARTRARRTCEPVPEHLWTV